MMEQEAQNSQQLMDEFDPSLMVEIITYPDNPEIVVMVRDKTRDCFQAWRVGSFMTQGVPVLEVQLPLTRSLCARIHRYFELKRKMHPESFLRCECHKHLREPRA